MKKRYIAISIMALALIAFIPVSGQTIQQISPWIFGAGNVIKPLNNSSHVQVPSLGSSGDPCIKVDASGNLSTTTCGGTASLTWGSITGTLSSQTDLQNALNAKEPQYLLEPPRNTGAEISHGNLLVVQSFPS